MRVVCTTCCYRDLNRDELTETLDGAPLAGYRYIDVHELPIPEEPERAREHGKEIREQCLAHGLEPVGVRGYESLEHRARVVALAEVDEDRRHAAGERLGPGVRLYANWLEMLDAEQPDVLHVVTSPRIPRADWVRPAAAAGVSVLALEKPIALVPSDAARLYEAADETGLKIAVNLQRRYMPFADKLIALLDDARPGSARSSSSAPACTAT